VAKGIHFGKDGQAATEDDVLLDPVEAQWTLEEEVTRENDDDLEYLKAPIVNGLYTPITTYAPMESREQTREGVGLIAVKASYTPENGDPLTDRALLAVTDTDFIPQIK
jgi:quinohemoprotein amine dehydrogenase